MRKVLYRKQVRINKSNSCCGEMINEGYFHAFEITGKYANAMIEDLEGNVFYCNACDFKFVDSPEGIDISKVVDIPKPIDWEQRRYEIAKELYVTEEIKTADIAVKCADLLINALKGE